MEEHLKQILSAVNEHQRFAETKNGALLAFDAALVFGVLQILTSDVAIEGILTIYLVCVGVGGIASGVVSLISFIPQTHIPWLRILKDPLPADSLIFFGDVQKYNPDTYLEALSAALGRSRSTVTKLDRMYAEQIIVNGRIAARKFTYFKYAIWICLAGLLTPIGIALLGPVIRDRHSE